MNALTCSANSADLLDASDAQFSPYVSFDVGVLSRVGSLYEAPVSTYTIAVDGAVKVATGTKTASLESPDGPENAIWVQAKIYDLGRPDALAANVYYRTHVAGGAPPTATCDASSEGSTTPCPFAALYAFVQSPTA